jgi:hypothetical protein
MSVHLSAAVRASCGRLDLGANRVSCVAPNRLPGKLGAVLVKGDAAWVVQWLVSRALQEPSTPCGTRA